MSEQRLGILEQRVDHSYTVMERMDKKLDGIAEALQSFARIEERQIAIADRLREGSATLASHDERLRRVELAVPENLNKRLGAIEVGIPPLIESRRWVVGGVLAGIGMILVAVAHLVLKG